MRGSSGDLEGWQALRLRSARSRNKPLAAVAPEDGRSPRPLTGMLSRRRPATCPPRKRVLPGLLVVGAAAAGEGGLGS